MVALLVGYLAFTLVVVLSVAGPLVMGRWLADREAPPDPEIAALEAQALLILTGSSE